MKKKSGLPAGPGWMGWRAIALIIPVLLGGNADRALAQSVQAWHVPAAPARFVVEPDFMDKRARLGWVQLNLPDPRWAGTPVFACDESGKRVGAEWFWSAPGEPNTVCFDSSSGAGRYFLYLGSIGFAQKTEWDTRAGVVLETREGDGKTMHNLDDMMAAWNKDPIVFGRSMLNGIFDGTHRHGPTGNVISHYQGWFDLDAPAKVGFVTISTDASFVLVDGKLVVAWPGRHGFHEGRWGKFRDSVALAAGLHRLEYFNAYVSLDDGRPLLCSLGVKAGDKPWAMLMPDNDFIRRSVHAHVTIYETIPQGVATGLGQVPPKAPIAAWSWRVTEQSLPSLREANVGFITVEFICHPSSKVEKCLWSFGDGTTAEGASVSHVFARPGPRTIRLAVYDGPKAVSTPPQEINVHPDWPRLVGEPRPELNPTQRAALVGRDPTGLSASDLMGCLNVFMGFDDSGMVLKLVPALCSQIRAIAEPDLPSIQSAALLLTGGEAYHADDVQRLLRALLERCSQGSPSSDLKVLASRARLTLAQSVLRTSDQLDEVRSLIKAIDGAVLSSDERRARDSLQGDLALASGDIEAARKQYLALSGELSGIDVRSAVRRTSMIDTINSFIDRREFEAAERALHEVEWQTPIEKLSSDCALARVQLLQATGRNAEALCWARRLLPAFTGAGARSELLFRIIELAFNQGDNALARKTLRELLERHPYSERAARAKQQWPKEPDFSQTPQP